MKPEERLTIEGVLAHPWLNCTEALDNVLPSAQMMMDKVSGKPKPFLTGLKVGRSTSVLVFPPGSSRWYPAGACGAAGQHEDSRSERQPEAFKLCQQPNPQEAQTTRVLFIFVIF